ncbi:hypothetical protein QTP70_003723 [Hemibagrus guttatus]|uniref:Uncharacterized protein n=1 Tax=Hemibagrus guttatus TaxID=175788 RepID=A0AAE0VBA8_9TELE|nr:hypothetical protein QTP70_003723 [Hemibagrus guttatus]
MKVSRSKTEYMCVNEREGSGTVRLQGEEVKKVQEFKYLGSTVQSNGECGKENMVQKDENLITMNIKVPQDHSEGACAMISPNPEDDILLSALGSEELNVDTIEKVYRIQFATCAPPFQGVLPNVIGKHQTTFLRENMFPYHIETQAFTAGEDAIELHSVDLELEAGEAPGEDLSPSVATRLRDLDPKPLCSPSRDGVRRGTRSPEQEHRSCGPPCWHERHQAEADGDAEKGLHEPVGEGTHHIAHDEDHRVRTTSHIPATSLPGPEAAKQPQTITLPPPYFTVGMMFFF